MKSLSVKWVIDVITILHTLQKQYIQGLSDIFGMNISSPSFSHLLILPVKKENNFVMVTVIYVMILTSYKYTYLLIDCIPEVSDSNIY